ncbi:MAG: coproporphyrinogen III oxidase family protein, partial [Muribaculaceae bacterium]|nr:coproporphyrinogen III oxidase family protein [Muribaculaceae bacterium]
MNGLYIHIPFCRSKCIYCDFYSTPSLKNMEEVVRGIIKEYACRRHEVTGTFKTAYLGGGTPSILPPELLSKLVSSLDIDSVEEFTIEVNPDDVTPEAAKLWKSLGINRVSMGVQSLDDGILRWMRRRHDSATALNAIEILRTAGFDNISCDLIYGIPGLSENIWRKSLCTLLATGIEHLSSYCLTYSPGTALQLRLDAGKDARATDNEIERQYHILRQETSRHEFNHYEISNFAVEGRHSRHNSIYWSPDGQWLGLGPSAHSFDGSLRRIDIADMK